MMTDHKPHVTFVSAVPEAVRRDLHPRNSDEPCPTPAPWVILTVPAVCLPPDF